MTLEPSHSMTPRDFLTTVVQPNVTEFTENVSDLRLAYNAVSAVDALAAHLYAWATTNASAAVSAVNDDSQYRAKLAARNQDFALLRDIAKAQKHVQLYRHNPKVSRADQIASQPIGWDEVRFDTGRYGGATQVVVNLGATGLASVESIVLNSLDFLKSEMNSIGA